MITINSKYQTAIAPDDAAILRRCTFTADSLTLPSTDSPDGRLSRTDYQRIAKIIEAAGGKWNKKRECHVFASGHPETIFAAALAKGGIVNERKQRQAFFTPPAIAKRLVEYAGITGGMSVLEPSAGEGSLVEAIARKTDFYNIVAVEIDAPSAAILDAKKLCQPCFIHDFLTAQTTRPAMLGDFMAVVMNPPFTRGQDITHVIHALRFVRVGGAVTAITAPGWQHQQSTAAEQFRGVMEKHGRVLEELPAGTFRESGTDAATLIIQLRR